MLWKCLGFFISNSQKSRPPHTVEGPAMWPLCPVGSYSPAWAPVIWGRRVPGQEWCWRRSSHSDRRCVTGQGPTVSGLSYSVKFKARMFIPHSIQLHFISFHFSFIMGRGRELCNNFYSIQQRTINCLMKYFE